MQWIEVTSGLIVNLEHVKGIARDGDRCTLYVGLSDDIDEVSTNLSYDVLSKIVLRRAAKADRRVDEIIRNTRTLSKSAYTPVP